jgi:hypothetical protein
MMRLPPRPPGFDVDGSAVTAAQGLAAVQRKARELRPDEVIGDYVTGLIEETCTPSQRIGAGTRRAAAASGRRRWWPPAGAGPIRGTLAGDLSGPC